MRGYTAAPTRKQASIADNLQALTVRKLIDGAVAAVHVAEAAAATKRWLLIALPSAAAAQKTAYYKLKCGAGWCGGPASRHHRHTRTKTWTQHTSCIHRKLSRPVAKR
jgi:hypothetical protein